MQVQRKNAVPEKRTKKDAIRVQNGVSSGQYFLEWKIKLGKVFGEDLYIELIEFVRIIKKKLD